MAEEDNPPNNLILLQLPKLSSSFFAPKNAVEPIEDRETPPPHLLSAALEAVLFVSPEPLSLERLNSILGKPGAEVLYSSLRDLRKTYQRQERGFFLVEVARGWHFRTDPRFAKWPRPLSDEAIPKLSKAALEALSIVAYHQPSTKSDVDTLRGVDSAAVLKALLEYDLIEIQGRKEGTGTAMVYGTTSEFLSLFNLRDLSDLPSMRDLQEIEESDEFPFL
jgi:segregation and condensation protein B